MLRAFDFTSTQSIRLRGARRKFRQCGGLPIAAALCEVVRLSTGACMPSVAIFSSPALVTFRLSEFCGRGPRTILYLQFAAWGPVVSRYHE